MTSSPSGAPLPLLLLLLSATTGMVDAISVLGLGKVFTANMTGNVVFLGFAAAGLPGFQALSYLTAIVSFLAGAAVGGATGKRHAGRPLRHWLMKASLVEAGLLCIAGIVALIYPVSLNPANASLYLVITLTGVAMGFRNATVRQLKVPDLTTTVLTLTLTGVAADSSIAGGENPNLARRIASVVTIFIGAAVGALMVAHLGLAPPLFAAAFVILAGTALCAMHPSSVAAA
jgi:uncharacterized membrane protein YoaK (UPF0700 family)